MPELLLAVRFVLPHQGFLNWDSPETAAAAKRGHNKKVIARDTGAANETISYRLLDIALIAAQYVRIPYNTLLGRVTNSSNIYRDARYGAHNH